MAFNSNNYCAYLLENGYVMVLPKDEWAKLTPDRLQQISEHIGDEEWESNDSQAPIPSDLSCGGRPANEQNEYLDFMGANGYAYEGNNGPEIHFEKRIHSNDELAALGFGIQPGIQILSDYYNSIDAY